METVSMKEFNSYQMLMEQNTARFVARINELEDKLNKFYGLIDINKYINSCMLDKDIYSTINDMLIGVIGATDSTLYVVDNGRFKLKVTSKDKPVYHEFIKELNLVGNVGSIQIKPILINNNITNGKELSYKCISTSGVALTIREEVKGFIVVENSLFNCFDKYSVQFLQLLGNQIALVLENRELYYEIKNASEIDLLTSLYNRRGFYSKVAKMVKKNRIKNYAIIMVDIDNFKKCNDTYGHQFGDEVLIRIASIFKESAQDDLIIGRYGGEEIIIFLDNPISREYVIYTAENLRERIEKNIVNFDSKSFSVTLSLGVGFSDTETHTVEELIKIADRRMYLSKTTGRNKVTYKD